MTISIKALEILDAFEVYDNRGIFDDCKRNDKLLTYMMDRTKIPSFRSYKKVITGQKTVGVKGDSNDIVENQQLTRDDLTTEQLAELEQMTQLMDGEIGGTYWDTRDGKSRPEELKETILRIPPVLREQLLIIAIMIYLLRHRDAEFDSETKAFGEFYYNFRDIVLGTHLV